MKKLISAMMALALAAMPLCGCAQKSASPTAAAGAATSSRPAQATSAQLPPSSATGKSNSTPQTVPRLDEAFYTELANLLAHFPLLGDYESNPPGNGALSSPAEVEAALITSEADWGPQVWPMFFLIWMDTLAAEAGAPTPFNLRQYATADGYEYVIPAAVAHDAILAWYGLTFDVSRLGGEAGDYDHTFYDEAGDAVVVRIEGLGTAGPADPHAAVLDTFEDGIATAHADIYSWRSLESDEPLEGDAVYWYTLHITLRENEDGSYTLLAVSIAESP